MNRRAHARRIVSRLRAARRYGRGRETVGFAEVGGLAGVKDDIRMRIVLPYQRPDLFAAYGKKRGGGLLLYGPPGCGKTLLARATAGEVGATFINVAINEVVNMWFGESERTIAALFRDARRRAPAVLFFDEVDALAGSREAVLGPGRMMVNQLLSELDGVHQGNDGVLVMAATNAPWHVDLALMRPGRFDDVVFVPPPDDAARREILGLLLRSRPTGDLELDELVQRTDGFSGADLAGVVEKATDQALRESIRTDRRVPIAHGALLAAIGSTRSTARDWFDLARPHATGRYEELARHLGG